MRACANHLFDLIRLAFSKVLIMPKSNDCHDNDYPKNRYDEQMATFSNCEFY